MKKVLFLTNIPAPYRIDFFNELGRYCDLTVVFEARRAAGIRFNWNEGEARFRAVFLSDGEIDETHVDRRILRYVKRGAYDEIVATSYGYYTETTALLKMRLLGIPYSIEIDGGVVRPGEGATKCLVKRYLITGATRLFSSGAASDAVFLHYGGKRERLVRYPFTSLREADVLACPPTATEKAALKRALGVSCEKLVLSVGQFIHRKGYDVLLPICSRLAPGTGVYLVGGEPTAEYRALVEEYGLSNVHFVPFMEKAALDQWYLAADAFVLPTREDMWGLVVNEAMAKALPVVTTDRCNAGAALVQDGKNGYLVPIEDGEALLMRLNEILCNDDLRVGMADHALSAVRDYTIEGMARVHLAAFGGTEGGEA